MSPGKTIFVVMMNENGRGHGSTGAAPCAAFTDPIAAFRYRDEAERKNAPFAYDVYPVALLLDLEVEKPEE